QNSVALQGTRSDLMEIRKSLIKEHDSVVKLTSQMGKNYDGTPEFCDFNNPGRKAALIRRELQAHPDEFLVAEENDEILGWLQYAEEEKNDTTSIHDLIVDAKHRNKGVASALIEKVSENKKEIRLEVNEKNTGAIKLFEKLGFRPMMKSIGMSRTGRKNQ
ncbi:MAG: GNAT family N-acetyltransferase, partial [DPANN group archaeon]|nr:GNAT family N-acetyltransferase [DPANN group archaeon]